MAKSFQERLAEEKAKNPKCTDASCQYCKGSGEIKISFTGTNQVSYFECKGGGFMASSATCIESAATPNSTQLSTEVVKEIEQNAKLKLIRNGNTSFNRGYYSGEISGATEYATKLHQTEEEHKRLIRVLLETESKRDELGSKLHQAEQEVEKAANALSLLERERTETRLALRGLLKSFAANSPQQAAKYKMADYIFKKYHRTVDVLRGVVQPGGMPPLSEPVISEEDLKAWEAEGCPGHPKVNGKEITIKPGLEFRNVNMPTCYFTVLLVNPKDNQLEVRIVSSNGTQWAEKDWNLKHTQWAFEKGEYYLAPEKG